MEKLSFKILSILRDVFTILFNFLSAIFTHATTEQTSIHNLSAPKDEFSEPSSPASSGYELDPGFVAMVRKWPFSRKISEDPYDHLQEFEELCLGLVVLGSTQETLRWKLFPFSLTERAEQWYTRTIGNMIGDWEELQNNFCYSFSLTKCIDSLLIDILDFEQLEKESIGAAWARFLRLLASSPDLFIPEDISLNIFYLGLDMEAALELGIASGGWFSHVNPTEERVILDSLLENFLSYRP